MHSFHGHPFYQHPATTMIPVSPKEATDQMTILLNKRLNRLLDSCPLAKVRAELGIDIEKSFGPPRDLGSIIASIESFDVAYHFEYDMRDDHVKFVPNGSTVMEMPVLSNESLLVSSTMPSSSLLPSAYSSRRLPVNTVCDMINKALRDAPKGKYSVARVHSDVEFRLGCPVEMEDLMHFIETHVETGDIHATMANPKCPMLVYQEQEKGRTDDILRVEMSSMSVGGKGDGRAEREAEEREEERRREQDKVSMEKKTVQEERRIEMRLEAMREAFPLVRRLGHLTYLLQTVFSDCRSTNVNVLKFEQYLNEVIGGSVDYSLFGLSAFPELIYHRVLEPDRNNTVRLNDLLEDVRVEIFKSFLASATHEFLKRKNGAAMSLTEIARWLDEQDSDHLHREFPSWSKMDDSQKEEEIRAACKWDYEPFSFTERSKITVQLNDKVECLYICPFYLI